MAYTINLAGSDNQLVLQGTGALTIPGGSTSQRPNPSNGMIRYNTDTNTLDVFVNSIWQTVQATTGVGSGFVQRGGDTMTGNLVMSGSAVISAQSGTAGNPSYTFSGNTTSGFYSPGSNQVGLSLAGSPVATFQGSGAAFQMALDLGNHKLTSVATPTASTDGANKAYVDSAVTATVKTPVAAATTQAQTLGSDFVAGLVIDGYTLQLNDRILLKNQINGVENGLYNVTNSTPTRTSDGGTGSLTTGSVTYVQQGTINAGSGYILTTVSPTIGTTPLTFATITRSGAGSGLSITNNTISVVGTSGRIVVGSSVDLTSGVISSPGTFKSVTVDTYGRVTSGTIPTTLAGFGITDAFTQAQSDSRYLLSATTPVALANNTTNGSITTFSASNNSVIFYYSYHRSTTFEIGQLSMITNGSTVNVTQTKNSINAQNVTLSAVVSGGNWVVTYTTDNSGSAGSLSYSIRQWNVS